MSIMASESFDNIDDFFEHYGIPGMKWGQRKASSVSSGPSEVTVKTAPGKKAVATGGKGQPPSEDAIKAVAAFQKAKASSVHSLTNAELQQLTQRMELEKKYAAAVKYDKEMNKSGKDFAATLLKGTVGKLVVEEVKASVAGKQGPISKFEAAMKPAKGKHRK